MAVRLTHNQNRRLIFSSQLAASRAVCKLSLQLLLHLHYATHYINGHKSNNNIEIALIVNHYNLIVKRAIFKFRRANCNRFGRNFIVAEKIRIFIMHF